MFNIRDEAVHSIEGINNDHLSVSWMLGNFCVYKCSYCPSMLHDGSYPYHPIESVLGMLEKLPDKTVVTFLGGEPTYHPDFERILLEKPDHVKIDMVSNGAKPLEFWKKISPLMGSMTFTFHPEFANADRFIENAQEVSKYLKDFRVFMIMHPDKWDYCVEAYTKLKTCSFPIIPKPVLKDFTSDASMDPRYTESQLAWLTEKSGSNFKSITIYDKDRNVLLKTNPSHLLSSGQTDFSGFKCFSPQQHITIRLNQDIYDAMCQQGKIIGDINSKEFVLPSEPKLCTQTFCKCQADLCVKKIR